MLRLPACLNESPSEKEGKLLPPVTEDTVLQSLNESPSEKEGKWALPYLNNHAN